MVSEMGDLMAEFYPGLRINEVSTTMLALLLLSRGDNVEWMRGMVDEINLPNYEIAAREHPVEVEGNTTANLGKILWCAQNASAGWSYRFVRKRRRNAELVTVGHVEFSFTEPLDVSKFFFSFTDAKPIVSSESLRCGYQQG
jgi:hypothetical protein